MIRAREAGVYMACALLLSLVDRNKGALFKPIFFVLPCFHTRNTVRDHFNHSLDRPCQ